MDYLEIYYILFIKILLLQRHFDLSFTPGGSGTDSQTFEVSLSGNVLQLLPENTTVTKTVVPFLTCRRLRYRQLL